MTGRAKITIASFSTVLAAVLIMGALLGQEKSPSDPYRPLAVLSEVFGRIQTDYVEDPDFTEVTHGALRGLLESLDPYSSYLTPEEYKQYREKRQGEAAIGAVISKRFGFVSIVTTLPNSPAQQAGLRSGDIIESLDGRSTREMSLVDIVSRLEGAPGSTVTLSVVRERTAEPTPIEVTRAAIVLPDAEGRMVNADIGYLRVEALPKGETPKIAARLRELRQQGAKKFILDLRDNASGEIEEGVATANLFLKRGLISYLSGQQYPRRSFIADSGKAISEEPLVVLVNRFSGGAAEVVAAAVLENHRGDVVGERTYGIGSIQKVIPLDDGSALILSIAKYFTPGGKEIQNNGITPNVLVAEEREIVPLPGDEQAAPLPESQQPPEDAPLKRAIELLAAQESQPQAA